MTDANNTTAQVRVRMIDESEAEGRLAELYADIKQATSLPFVPDMFRMMSTRPSLLEAVAAGYKAMFLEGGLPRSTRELIAAWTSKLNQCSYCVGTHNFFFQAFGGSAEVAQAVETAETAADLPVDEATQTLLHLLTKLSREAYKITDADWQQATDAGWTNDDLLEACFIAGMFNFINRFVDGLGLGTSVAASRTSQMDATAGGQA